MGLFRTKIRPRDRLNYIDASSIHLLLSEQPEAIGINDLTRERALVFAFFVRFGQSSFAILRAFILVLCNEFVEFFFFFFCLVTLQRPIIPLKKTPVRLSVQDRNIVGLDVLFPGTAILIQSLLDDALLIGVILREPGIALIRLHRASHYLAGVNRNSDGRCSCNCFDRRI
jgi:hypothetical protein